MKYDFDIEEAFKIWGYGKGYYELNGINDFLILNPDFPSKNVLNWLGNQYCFDWK